MEPVLNQQDRQSATWLRLKRHLEERLQKLRVKNDRDLDERVTARLRGAIEELKHLCSLDAEIPVPPPEDQFKD